MLKTISLFILLPLVVAVAAILIFAATKPDTMHFQRSASIKAPPDKILSFISDFQKWGAWSPYEHKDPAMKRTYSGASAGKGAVYEWEGDKNVGKGRMEITELSPPSNVKIKLDFIKPFEAHNTAEFTLEPKGDSTTVTWAMYGPCSFISKVMSVFIDMDRMIGKDFETGLASLKTVTEKQGGTS
jgi:carbon monoxide dehydrogenase subunit G